MASRICYGEPLVTTLTDHDTSPVFFCCPHGSWAYIIELLDAIEENHKRHNLMEPNMDFWCCIKQAKADLKLAFARAAFVVGDDDDDMDEKFQQRKENDSEEKDNDGSEDGDSDEGSDSDGDSDSDTTEYPDDDAVGIIRNMSGYPRDEAPETRLEAVERHLDYTEEQHM